MSNRNSKITIVQLRGKGLDCIGNLITDGHVRPMPYNGEKYVSLVDMMAVFGPEGNDPRVYWNQQKKRLLAKDEELCQSLIQLPLTAADGKRYKTDVAPLWACVFIVLLMDTSQATLFKKGLAKFVTTPEEIKYRMRNVASGKEWSADTIHEVAMSLEPVPDSELKWWQR